ncbi:MAG TPA: hypothetical protein VLT33_33675 [Labilithrix sp.]|nr:hypothetical protein [Labilithrix sp.]
MRFRFVSFLAGLFIVTAPASANAGPNDAAQAEALFNSGKEAMTHGDLATACARLGESYKLDPAVGTLLNLATCEERSGKLLIALEHFTAARSQLPKNDFRVGFTNERIAALSPRIAHVTVRVPPSGTRALCDGIEVPSTSWNVPLEMDPGAHAFVIETQGRPASHIDITLREGEERTVAPDPEQAPPPAPVAVRSAPPDPPPPSRAPAYVVGGIGVAGLVTGVITGLVTMTAASTYKDHCHNGQCDSDGLSAASAGRTAQVVSPIAFAVGAVGVAAGVWLFVASSKTQVAVSPSGASFTWTRTF